MNRYAAVRELKKNKNYKRVWRVFRSDETLEEVQARFSYEQNSEIVSADNAPEKLEADWVYYPDTGIFAQPITEETEDSIHKQIHNLDKRYQNRLDRICLDYIAATIDEDTTNQERVKIEKQEIMQEYLTKRQTLMGEN